MEEGVLTASRRKKGEKYVRRGRRMLDGLQIGVHG